MDELRADRAVPHPGRAAAPRDRRAGACAQLDRAPAASDRGSAGYSSAARDRRRSWPRRGHRSAAACPRIASDNRSSLADARTNSLTHTKPDADSHAAHAESHPDAVAAGCSGPNSSDPRTP